MSNSLWPHELQHARPPWPSPSPGSLHKPMSIELVMPSIHLILCHLLLLLPPMLPSIRVFSNESTLCLRWSKYWSFSFNISPSSEQSPLGWTGWISLQSKGLSRVFSNTTVQKHQFYAPRLHFLFLSIVCYNHHVLQYIPSTCCSVAQSYPTLCGHMDCSMPGFPVHHPLLELAETHVHWVSDAIQPSHPVVPFSSCLLPFLASESFPMNWLFASSGQSIGTSVSISVLPRNIQGWFPLGLTRLISLQSKGLLRVFSNTTIQKH